MTCSPPNDFVSAIDANQGTTWAASVNLLWSVMRKFLVGSCTRKCRTYARALWICRISMNFWKFHSKIDLLHSYILSPFYKLFHPFSRYDAQDSKGFWWILILLRPWSWQACLFETGAGGVPECQLPQYAPTGLRDNLEGNWWVNLDISKLLVMATKQSLQSSCLFLAASTAAGRNPGRITIPCPWNLTWLKPRLFTSIISYTHNIPLHYSLLDIMKIHVQQGTSMINQRT